jgi:hypothetical protein
MLQTQQELDILVHYHYKISLYAHTPSGICTENNHLGAGLGCRVVIELVEVTVLHRDLNIP